MNLREQAEADLAFTIEDGVSGFGWPITITAPDQTTRVAVGISNDISQLIDPETGIAVRGRHATVVLRMAPLLDSGFGIPKGVSDSLAKPWLIAFDDINGAAHTFKVRDHDPDRALGVVVCTLEAYE